MGRDIGVGRGRGHEAAPKGLGQVIKVVTKGLSKKGVVFYFWGLLFCYVGCLVRSRIAKENRGESEPCFLGPLCALPQYWAQPLLNLLWSLKCEVLVEEWGTGE